MATVDRVLNGRLPVREETARRVYDAARDIGYHATGLIRQRIEREVSQYRLGFLLQRPDGAWQAVRFRFEPLSTLSRGYDSPACAIIAQASARARGRQISAAEKALPSTR